MSKINGGYSCLSFGPAEDLTPHDDSAIPVMSMSIPNHSPQMGTLTDQDPYAGIGAYGSGENPPAMDSDEVGKQA